MVDLSVLIRKKAFEKIIFLLRRHWLIFLGDVLLIVVLGAVPFGLYFGIKSAAPNLLADALARPAIVLLATGVFFVSVFLSPKRLACAPLHA